MRLWIPCLVILLTLWITRFAQKPRATLTFSRLGEYGRLGNQLFQIASVYGVARAYGIPAVFPTLPELEHAFELTHITRSSSLKKHDRIWYLEDPTVHTFPSPPFTGIIDCRGYFQHQDYFRHVASDIREAFRLRRHLCAKIAPLITPTTVGVHVRRGDYIDVLPASYYREAVAALVSKTRAHVIVCSDDIPWCKANLELDPRWNVTYSPWSAAIDDFATLVECPAMVMSNSSFSWWAAWLGDHPRGVIMPWPWYGSTEAWKNDNALAWNRKEALVNPLWTLWTVPRSSTSFKPPQSFLTAP